MTASITDARERRGTVGVSADFDHMFGQNGRASHQRRWSPVALTTGLLAHRPNLNWEGSPMPMMMHGRSADAGDPRRSAAVVA